MVHGRGGAGDRGAGARALEIATPFIALATPPRARPSPPNPHPLLRPPRLSAQAAESNAGYSFEQAGALWAKHLGQMNAWNEKIKLALADMPPKVLSRSRCCF